MEKAEYNCKIMEYVHTNNVDEIHNDPTAKYLKEINNVINETKIIIKQNQKFHLKMIKPTMPQFKAQIKVHKNNKIRPLVNFTTAPSYKLAKVANEWITKRVRIQQNYSVKNPIELVDKIKNITIPPNAKMVSFDITNMYSNVPVEEAVRALEEILISNDVKTEEIVEIIKIVGIITKQNYFQHDGKMYQQNYGLAMGNPLSGTLANLFINHNECHHIFSEENIHRNKIVYWHRYVDDILLLFNGTQRQLSQLQNYINSISPKLQFTIEQEINKNIKFLDLSITNINNKHEFSIHRKPTHTDHTIHNTSNHPINHKLAAYTHMIHRLNNIPMSTENYAKELKIIKYIATKNGFNDNIIKNMNQKYKRKAERANLTTLTINTEERKKYISLNYNHAYNKIVKKTFEQHGYRIAYKTNGKLSQKLQTKTNQATDTGIYKLSCNNCAKFYIGQTGRSFKKRFSEHVQEIKKPTSLIKSNYALHFKNNNHTFTGIDDNLSIMHKINKGNMMDRLEEIEIYKEKQNDNILNDRMKRNLIYDYIINISTPVQ